MVLVSRNCHKLGLGERNGLEVLCLRYVFRLGIHVNYVEAGLVFMHGVQYDLEKKVFGDVLRMMNIKTVHIHYSAESGMPPSKLYVF